MQKEKEIADIKKRIAECENRVGLLNMERKTITDEISETNLEISYAYNELRKLGECNHRYSKTINQSWPRLCVDCGQPETPMNAVQVVEKQSTCNHLYSRSMNQPYPRLCELCRQPEPNHG